MAQTKSVDGTTSAHEEDILDDYKPRPYQDQILDIALRENVIVYLPTGAGKTYIAMMAIRRMSSDLRGSFKNGAKRSVFLCNTVALAKQQYDVLKKFTNLKVSLYTGDLNVDNWKNDKWEFEFESNQVIVATVQIIVDVVRHGYIKIPNFNLIIFDECHHAKGEHPMFQLMGLFKKYPENQLPRVIGLTGLLINPSTRFKIVEDLNNLEATYRGKIVTVENFDEFQNVLIYSTKPVEIVLTYQEYCEPLNLQSKVEMLINKCINLIDNWCIDKCRMKLTKSLEMERAPNPIKSLINLLKDFVYQMKDMGIYAASIAISTVLIELELKKRAADTIKFRNLLRICISYAENIRHFLIKTMYDTGDDDDDDDQNEENIIMLHSTHKLKQLLLHLKLTFRGKNLDDMKCLIFAQRRHTAKCLYHLIKKWAKHNSQINIVPEFMVGHNAGVPESVETVLDAKWNKNVLRAFKSNESNLIVCSSVLEEGIDIQSCNHVIIFDKILSFRSYIQSKGRARQNDSKYVIMVAANEKAKVLLKINEYKEIDKTLKEFLIGKTIDRKSPLKEDIDKQFETDIEPFYTPTNACLEAASAIQLLHRYCMTLPRDLFTVPSVDWKKHKKNGAIYVSIFLPLQSRIKNEIWSDPQKTVKLAKQSAAFNACKQLYKLGEFGDNLLPISKVHRAKLVGPIYFKHWDDFKDDNPKEAGTKQNKRLYNVEHPHQLYSSTPLENSECYLYTISLSPQFECNDDNEHLINLFSQPNTYGILTMKKLPKIAEIPLFMNYGQVHANISYNPIPIKDLSHDDITYLRKFHVMIFRDLLQIWKNFLAYDYRNEENSFLIVPTLNGRKIDWDLVKKFQELSKIIEPTEIQRENMNFNKTEDYIGNIICPWYSVDTDIRYVVTKVRSDLTPFSPFPSMSYKNFADYIFDKYKKRVLKSDQFLLEVKPITTRLNFLHYHDEGGKKKKSLDILLIPELSHNFLFPGDMYLKAKFLPSILHRLHYMLHAENLRENINKHLGLNFPDYTPNPLIIDTSLRRIQNQKNIEKTTRSVVSTVDRSNRKSSVMVKTDSMTENSQYMWKEYEEPTDLTRMIDNVFKIELDYYYQFVTNKLNKLSISTPDEILPVINTVEINKKFAICDVPLDAKSRINIIDINEPLRSAEQWEFLSAITSASSGDVFDMERIELLGDSFLKFSISLYLLHKHPQWNEGYLTIVKGQFVSNRNLLYCAVKRKLPGILCVSSFNPRNDWLPPLVCVPIQILEKFTLNNISPSVLWDLYLNDEEITSGRCDEEKMLNFVSNIVENEIECDLNLYVNKQVVSDKTVADSVEAILGVCVKNYGIKRTFSVLELFGICPDGDNLSNLLNLDLGNPRIAGNTSNAEIDAFLINYEQLEEKLGYKFNDRAYMLQALTHPSFLTNRLTGCYQQLEFIGDAILDFLISCYIYERCTDMDPGQLTDLRSSLVNNITLACIVVRNNFHLFMLQQSATLSQSIEHFVNFQETQNMNITDQVRVLIEEDENNPDAVADYVDVPKALGDIFESLVGAVFLDSKNNLKRTWQVVYNLMKNEINQFMRNVPINTVRQLYEYHGANPQFSEAIDLEDFVMVTCKFNCREKICETNGFAKNKEQAKIAAAKLALQILLKA